MSAGLRPGGNVDYVRMHIRDLCYIRGRATRCVKRDYG